MQVKRQSVSFFTVAAFAFAGAAVWLWPLAIGALGLAFGGIAAVRRERLAGAALATVVAATVLGLLLHQLPQSFFN
jgi:hypothetical protein